MIPAPGRLFQKDHKFQACLDYVGRTCLKEPRAGDIPLCLAWAKLWVQALESEKTNQPNKKQIT